MLRLVEGLGLHRDLIRDWGSLAAPFDDNLVSLVIRVVFFDY
jgi:hypothetical protein